MTQLMHKQEMFKIGVSIISKSQKHVLRKY